MGKSLIIFFISFLLVGCLSTKKTTEKNKETTSVEKSEIKKDSSTFVNTNKAIKDNISTQVQPTGDPVLDAKIDAILMSLNSQKSSGDNSYKFYYDNQLRQLRAEFEIAKTKDSISVKSTDLKSEKSFTEQTDEYIEKKIRAIPWYVILFAILWFLPQIINKLKLIIMPIRGIVSKLFKNMQSLD